MTGKVAVILGGTGMVGANMAQLLDRQGDWDVTIVSRRAPEFATRARHVACDMSDPADCARQLGPLERTTHIFWTGHATGTKWVDKAARDSDLFRNAMTAIEAATPQLQHVCLLQGSKYYGRHLGPFKTPAKESDPRVPGAVREAAEPAVPVDEPHPVLRPVVEGHAGDEPEPPGADRDAGQRGGRDEARGLGADPIDGIGR